MLGQIANSLNLFSNLYRYVYILYVIYTYALHATGIRFVLYTGSVSAEAKKPFKNLILLKTNIS